MYLWGSFLTRGNTCVISLGVASKCSQIPHLGDFFPQKLEFCYGRVCFLIFLQSQVRQEQKFPQNPRKRLALNLGCLWCFFCGAVWRSRDGALVLLKPAPSPAGWGSRSHYSPWKCRLCSAKGPSFPTHHQKTNSINSCWNISGETFSVRKCCFCQNLVCMV